MSQYTISLKSIINIKSHEAPYFDDVFADTKKKIQRGREIFFNFDYVGDSEFKELFENAFIIKNLTENIFCYDVDLFMLALENDVKIRAPYFYKKYQAINELDINELSLGDVTTHTSERNANDSQTNKAKSVTKAQSDADGKTKSSQFPQDIVDANNFDSINYMDAGSATENSSSSSGTTDNDSSGTATHKETFTENTRRDISKVERLQFYLDLQKEIITDFVNSFNNLFMQIW